jgi:UDP-N-acetylmuramyl pentapeptide synthase
MTKDASTLMTAATMAKELGVSDAKVKKAIAELKLQPEAKKGICNYYSADTLKQLKASLT